MKHLGLLNDFSNKNSIKSKDLFDQFERTNGANIDLLRDLHKTNFNYHIYEYTFDKYRVVHILDFIVFVYKDDRPLRFFSTSGDSTVIHFIKDKNILSVISHDTSKLYFLESDEITEWSLR